MSVWEAILLGLVQGATEFLPVSSSGHLLFLEKAGVGTPDIFFNICLHLGTLLAVVVCLRADIFFLFRRDGRKTLLFLFLSCLPTGALALLFMYFAPSLVDGAMLPLGFMTTTALLVLARCFVGKPRFLDAKASLLAGVFQGVAVLPGISRSGATVAALRLYGVDKPAAAKFSFLMSLPVIVASALYEGGKIALSGEAPAVGILPLVAGTATAFLSGLAAIKFFLALFEKRSLTPFAVYTAAMSVASFLLFYL